MTEYHIDTLENGLRVVTVEMPHLHSAEMVCYVNTGGRNEEPELAGISHFLEHILFRGTEDYANSSLLERAFEAIGGAVNASTDSETTCFHSRLHPEKLAEGAQLFASMLLRPLFADIDVERRIILEEALEDLNEEGEDISVDNLTSRLLWPGHPLSLPTLGTRKSIARIGEQELRKYHEMNFCPQNSLIAVAGRAEHSRVLSAVKAAFGQWGGRAPEKPAPLGEQKKTSKPESTWVQDSDSQVTIQLVFLTGGRHDAGTLPLRVLRWILAWGGSSRLMLRLREGLGLTYSVDANLSLFNDTGCFSIDMAVAPENLVPAVRETLKVLTDLCEEEVGEAEKDAVINAYLYDLEFSRDHTDVMATRYGWGELVNHVRTIEMDRRQISATPTDLLQRTARQSFRPEKLKAAFVGPFKAEDRKEVEKLLGEFRK